MKIIILLFFFIICSLNSKGQSFVYMDNCIGGQGKVNVILLDFDIGVGQAIVKDQNFFGVHDSVNIFLILRCRKKLNMMQQAQFYHYICMPVLQISLMNLHLIRMQFLKVLFFSGIKILRFFFNPRLPKKKVSYEEDGIYFS